jgi:hypothetical protein
MQAALERAGKLDADSVVVDGVTLRTFEGSEATGPSPVAHRKSGTKHILLVGKNGGQLAIRIAEANATDNRQTLPGVLDYRSVGGTPGRPKESRTATGVSTARVKSPDA